MIELTFLKELMLIKQAHQKSLTFVTIGIFQIIVLRFQTNVGNRCHDLLMMSINHSDIETINIKGPVYRFIISLISKNEAINLLENTNLTEKSKTFKKNIKFVFISRNG